jgi:hypothetical protein
MSIYTVLVKMKHPQRNSAVAQPFMTPQGSVINDRRNSDELRLLPLTRNDTRRAAKTNTGNVLPSKASKLRVSNATGVRAASNPCSLKRQ